MTAKKWCISFLCIVLAILLLLGGFNIAVDPFGVFGDSILNWFSYDMTGNPRAAKITYLDEHHTDYDSYIVGASATSSFGKEDLDYYFGAGFYNMIHYGADMRDTEEICDYLIDNYTVKNLVVCITLSYGNKYDYESHELTGSMHPKTDGSSKLAYFMRFAYANPLYSVEKIKAKFEDQYLAEPYDVFDVTSGAYDKRERDIEPIGDMDRYLAAYPEFTDYRDTPIDMPYIDETAACLVRIKERCDVKGIRLEVVTAPLYYEFIMRFDPAQVRAFYEKIAAVTPFWDFSVSSLSHDPRFFYDETHFRNTLGAMSLAKMFENDSVYAPEDLGVYITPENAAEYVSEIWGAEFDDTDYTAKVPVLMYHNIGGENLSPELFESHIAALEKEGYQAVSLQQMMSFVERGTPLPENPVCITFDDGYYSNYEYAWPVLQEYNMQATIFVIGSSVGHKTNYKDTEFPITPHFTFEEAKEMTDSGLIAIESHTYDMHQWEPYESGDRVRTSILRLKDESETDYVAALKADFIKSAEEIAAGTGIYPQALAYPLGYSDSLSAAVLMELGVKMTFSIDGKGCTLIQGLPQSLYGLSRFYVQDDTTAEDILDYVRTNG